jgi:hypothetical protein
MHPNSSTRPHDPDSKRLSEADPTQLPPCDLARRAFPTIRVPGPPASFRRLELWWNHLHVKTTVFPAKSHASGTRPTLRRNLYTPAHRHLDVAARFD